MGTIGLEMEHCKRMSPLSDCKVYIRGAVVRASVGRVGWGLGGLRSGGNGRGSGVSGVSVCQPFKTY